MQHTFGENDEFEQDRRRAFHGHFKKDIKIEIRLALCCRRHLTTKIGMSLLLRRKFMNRQSIAVGKTGIKKCS